MRVMSPLPIRKWYKYMVRTVKGDIKKEALGVTMCHEHIALDLSPVRGDTDSTFDDRALITEELLKLKELGCDAVIEVSCNDMGRDVLSLRDYSEATGLHIVASTGFYLESYHPDFVKESDVKDIARLFVREISKGIDDTGIKAGVIGEVASGKDGMAESEKKVLSAAAMAAAELGCAVTTHCQLGFLALEQSKLLQSFGMAADKIVLGHLDLADDMDYYKRVLETGVNIGFDTCGKYTYLPDEKRADNLVRLLELGYGSKIMLSNDISRISYLTKFGKFHGYTAVLGLMRKLLEERGVSYDEMKPMLVDNPARIFDF